MILPIIDTITMMVKLIHAFHARGEQANFNLKTSPGQVSIRERLAVRQWCRPLLALCSPVFKFLSRKQSVFYCVHSSSQKKPPSCAITLLKEYRQIKNCIRIADFKAILWTYATVSRFNREGKMHSSCTQYQHMKYDGKRLVSCNFIFH